MTDRNAIADALETFRPLTDEAGNERYVVTIGPSAMAEIINCLRSFDCETPHCEHANGETRAPSA